VKERAAKVIEGKVIEPAPTVLGHDGEGEAPEPAV
jgi:hypothetical protein